jgi:hypothetical protein
MRCPLGCFVVIEEFIDRGSTEEVSQMQQMTLTPAAVGIGGEVAASAGFTR